MSKQRHETDNREDEVAALFHICESLKTLITSRSEKSPEAENLRIARNIILSAMLKE